MPHRKHLEQGEGGSRKTGKRGTNLKQSRQGGGKRGPSGSKFDQNPNNRRGRQSSGDHLTQKRSWVANTKSVERGGHNRRGHDKADPTAGKSKSGNHLDQHPSLKK